MDSAYQENINQWRNQTNSNLLSENSWLDLVCLHWLEQGETTFGKSIENDLPFPTSEVPDFIGKFIVEGKSVRAEIFEDIPVTLDGNPTTGIAALKADITGEPTELKVGTLLMIQIERGELIGIRAWDSQSQARKSFTGRKWFEIQDDYKVKA
ncbi:MAG: hypothetical protein N2D54_08675, partial [Chloroflexota bacterium]